MKTNQFLSYLRGLKITVSRQGDRLHFNAPQGTLTPALRADLTKRKTEILEFLSQANAASDYDFLPIVPVSRSEPLPLSFAQDRLWFLDQLMPGNAFYNIPSALRLAGELDVLALQRTLNEIIRRHETLHTRFFTVNGQATQFIASTLELTLAVIDLQSLPKVEGEHKARELASEMAQQPFNLTEAPLIRVMLLRLAPTEHVLLLVMHHIISDGWSIGVFHRELAVLYDTFVTGKTSPLPELSIQYADFAVWQRSWLEKTALKNQLLYWQQQLANLAVLQLPTDYARPAVQSFHGAVEILEVPLNLKQGLVKLSQQHGVTLFMTMLAAFKVLLHRYTGQTDIVVGSPIANRNRSEIEPLIGFFVNTLVLRTQIQSKECFSELLSRVQEVTLGAYAHQDLPFERLVEELLPERLLNSNPLVQVMFALQNAPMSELQLTGLQLSRLELEYNTTRFDMEWHVWEQSQGLQVIVFYATDLFAQQTIHRMLGHFQTLLDSVVANPQHQICSVPLLSTTEHQQLLFKWNDTDREYPHHKCIHQLFETQVEQTPDAVALVFEDQQLTYNELNVRANQLAHYLRSLGVGPEVLVGIYVERSLLMVVGLLGILKAGAVYVPLDPTYPQERLSFMLEDAQVSVLLTQQQWVERSEHQVKVVCLDTDWEAISLENQENPNTCVTSDNLAYVIYTSGSTGKPKGVAIAHQAVNRLLCNTNYINLEPSDKVAQASNASFDAVTFEIWGALLHGAQLMVVTKDVVLSPQDFAAYIREHEISVLFLTTALFNQIARVAPQAFSSVRHLLFGGEAADPRCVKEVLTKGSPQRLLHVYGPTESTTFSTWYLVQTIPQEVTPLPIGRPIANTNVYLLDSQLMPVPIGIPGELYIGGEGLARGYFNRPELTSEKFIPHPFTHQSGARLYKTGDQARYNSDGSIEFLGRIDNQVKLRGYRIELGEIESVLNQHPQVQQAVAIVREDSPSNQRLVAYCTQHSLDTINTNIESTEVSTEHVSQWQTIYDQMIYAQSSEQSDATFNIVGWNSSYTNQPIPPEQMRQWLNGRVNHLLAFQPKRVLEIGCGTGLLLFQIAPHCEHYYGTDFSDVALASIAQQLRHPEWHLPQVQLQHKLADDFEGIAPESFDTVILNSVVQYFPNIDYLLRVLVGAVKAVAPGGIIFVGDVRSLPLLEAMHASVQLYQAEAELSIEQLRQRVQTQMAQETELVIDPEFFLALKQHLPQITSVQIRLQRGEFHNELSCFRYDVTLEVGAGQSTPDSQLLWHEWEKEDLTIERTAQLLESQPSQLGIVNIPNARVLNAIETIELLSSNESALSIPQLRTAINSLTTESGVEPEQLWNMAQAHGYTLAISWSETEVGCYDVLFSRQSTHIAHKPLGGATPLERKKVQPRAWQHYANNPLQTQQICQLQLQLRNYLSARLPEYMVPTAIVMLSSLPLTPNGKVDRKALPAPEASRTHLTESYVAPRSPVEEILVSLWAEILGQQQVGIHDNFFGLGGHSLLATQLISRVRDVLQLELPLRYLFEAPTPAQLADSIAQIQGQNYAVESSAIEPVARNSELPLSFAQGRLWFLDQLIPGNPFYNMPSALRLAGELDVLALQRSLNEIIRRHETLRTKFKTVNGQATQLIAESLEVTLAVIDLQSLPKVEREQKARELASQQGQQPFDLSVAPLIRVMLLHLAPKEYILLFAMHHIISDGWSIGVFHRELAVLYDTFVTGITSPLPELRIQYADFAVWQRSWLEKTALKNQLLYWQQQLANLAVLQLPTDYARPAEQSFRGAVEILEVPLSLKQGLVKLSGQHGVTLFMTMLAAFKVLLHRYTGQTDIVVGSPIANRNRSEIEPLIGFFVNTLVLRTPIQSKECFDELLKKVRSVTLGAYAHQDLPFERLVEELQPERSLDSNPLVQVMFAVQNAPMSELQLTGLQLSRQELEYNTTRLDMEWHVWEQSQGLQVTVFYATDLFAQQTIKRMLGHFQTLLDAVVANPQHQIWEFPLPSTTEQQQLLMKWNDTHTEYPHHKCIHQLFETQVEQTPDAVALVFENQQLTYNELNVRANQLAHYLQSMGIGPEVLVGLCVERSPEMVVGMLGILKAGGAYVPLDPNYPRERLAYILDDACVSVLLTQQVVADLLPDAQGRVVYLDSYWSSDQYESNPNSNVCAENLAYAIYTSGSTGRPKGVQIRHRSVVNFLKSMYAQPGMVSQDVLVAVTTITFDIAALELFLPLSLGARVILTRDLIADGGQSTAALATSSATVMQGTPATWQALMQAGFVGNPQLKILCGGEALSRELATQLLECADSLWNMYGPTETTIWSAVSQVQAGSGSVSIGRAIANTQFYILDTNLQPVPVGVAGELHIGGDGLARGYLNRPELTAEKFIPNPFSSKAGERLYKTGDFVRYLSDGNIEYFGRIDNQVKLRGYRIELGEIESVLNQHPQVQQAVAIVREDSPEQERIVAYCTQGSSESINTDIESTEVSTEHVSQWQTIYDQTYAQLNQESDATFNIVGWNSSYTNQPIPQEQMRQWLKDRVNHLLAFQPRRVLEIGCGTGLLLFQIAPHCEHYYGTDFSDVALASIAQQLRHPEWHLPQVQLQQKLADDFAGVADASFDTVILNSVVQYFPSIDYLLRVLVGALKAVAPGGIVFIGDVRSLPLLEAIHASVQLYQAEDKLSLEGLRQRVQTQMAQETELVIDPEFFLALKQHLPQITSVQIRLQRGESHNELTSFRYDVTLHVEDGKSTPDVQLLWHEWEKEDLTVENTAKLLESQPSQLGIVNIPNARVLNAIKTIELLSSNESPLSMPQLRTAINSLTTECGVEPEQLWNMAQAHGYTLAISWSETEVGCYDVLFSRQSTHIAHKPLGGATPLERKKVQPRGWQHYANNPLQTQVSRQLQSQLRNYLSTRLPEYMVPSSIVMLSSLPLTPNGKVDRKALPAPETSQAYLKEAYVAPRTPLEEILVCLWAEILRQDLVGIHDNFFNLGGHSLLATQLISRVRDVLQLELSLRCLFEAPTPAQLAELIEPIRWGQQQLQSLNSNDIEEVEL